MVQTVVGTSKSTTVRTFAAPRPVRAAFALLERVAPGVGARWATRLWFTLPARRSQPGAGHPGGTRFQLAAPTTVAGETWGDGPPVYLVHGWAGHRGQFAHMVGPLVARGLRVVAFDMPSHGDSAPGAFGPRSTSFVEFTDALRAAVDRFGEPQALVAHSGGAIAAAGLLCDGASARRLVLLAPTAGAPHHLRQFAAALNLGPRTVRRVAALSERRVGAPMSHFDVVEIGRAVQMPPTLVIHDRDDRSTPVTDGAAIAAVWRGARLRVTSGLGHNKVLRSPEVIAEVVDFIDPS